MPGNEGSVREQGQRALRAQLRHRGSQSTTSHRRRSRASPIASSRRRRAGRRRPGQGRVAAGGQEPEQAGAVHCIGELVGIDLLSHVGVGFVVVSAKGVGGLVGVVRITTGTGTVRSAARIRAGSRGRGGPGPCGRGGRASDPRGCSSSRRSRAGRPSVRWETLVAIPLLRSV